MKSLLAASLMAAGASAWSVEVTKDLQYGTERPAQKLNLFLPDGPKEAKRPLAIVIHGGGWAIGSKDDKRETAICEYLAQNGVVAASVGYTLIKYEGKPWTSKELEAGWPANIEDCQAALSFLLSHAEEYGIDPNAVYAFGSSAGGHLALLLAYAQGKPWMPEAPAPFKGFAGVVSCYGIHDLRLFGASCFNGKTPEESKLNVERASASSYLSKSSPPTFLIHGGADKVVKMSVADDFERRLKEAGTPHFLWSLPEDGHGFALDASKDELRKAVLKFFKTGELPQKGGAANP